MKKAQISVEYLIILGFLIFVVISILGVAFFYAGNVRDKIVMSQVTSFANKVVSTAESVFYSGEPSKATISGYIPQEVRDIEILEDSLIIDVQTSAGVSKVSFSSEVPITGSITSDQGIKKIKIEAVGNQVVIS